MVARPAPRPSSVAGPSLRTLVRRALEGEATVAPRTAILVAVSGGPDSMALLDVVARLAPALGLRVTAHGVDHGLRAGATGELDLAEAHAARLGVAFGRSKVAVARGGNVQERARTARWRALTDVARQSGAAIATGHHADDRAETVLLRLLRGAGVRGLGVMPARGLAPHAEDVLVVRPLLRARRADVLRHLARQDVPSATDPSNADPRFLRARVRGEVLPLLEALDPRIVRHLCQIADEVADEVGAERPAGRGWTSGLPRPTQEAIARLLQSGSSTARVWLPGGLVVSLEGRQGARQGAGSTPVRGPRAATRRSKDSG